MSNRNSAPGSAATHPSLPQPIRAQAAPSPAAQTRSSWAVAGLSLVILLSSLGVSIANVALPTWVAAFDTTLAVVQWVVLAYLLAVTTVAVSVGRLGDLFGRRRLLLIGTGLFTLASLLCALASDLALLIAARALQGLGAAAMMTLAMAVVGDAVPKQRAGRAMGFLGTMSAIGTALGPSLGGVLIGLYGWPAIFWVKVPAGILAFLLIASSLPKDAPSAAPSARFDWPGSLLLMISLAAYALAMTWGKGALSLGLLSAALVIALLFLWLQTRQPAPLLRPTMFRNRLLSTGFVMKTVATTVAITTLVVGPFYLAGGLGLSSAGIGAVMSIGPLVAALVGVPAGRAVDRFGARRITLFGLLMMSLGSIGLSRLSVEFGVVGYVLPLAITTAGFAMFQAANNTMVLSGSEPGVRGVVSGLLGLSRNLGLITGASAMAAVFAYVVGGAGLASADVASIVTGSRAAFALAALLVGGALLLAWLLARPAAGRSDGERS